MSILDARPAFKSAGGVHGKGPYRRHRNLHILRSQSPGQEETFVREGLTEEDNADTAVLELRRMQDSVQLGPELGIMLTGAYKENIKYGASALFMQPVYHTAETDLEGFELLNMEFEVLLGFKVFKFLSVDYSFKAYKQPLIVDEWQIQNNLLVSIAFEVTAPPAPPLACPECPPAPACPEFPARPRVPPQGHRDCAAARGTRSPRPPRVPGSLRNPSPQPVSTSP